jgi:hypothetical protein
MSDHENDPLGYLGDHLTEARHFQGKDITPGGAAEAFLRQNQAGRAKVLAEIDNRLKDAHLSLKDGAKLHAFRSALIQADRLAKRVSR